MKVLLYLARASRRGVALALVSIVLGGLGAAWLVALVNEALVATPATMITLALLFAALALAVPLLRWLAQSQFARLQQAALARLRRLVSGHIAHVDYRELEAQGAPRLLSVLVEDVHTVSEFFVALPRLVMQSAIVLGGFAYLAFLSWQALAVVLVLVVLGSLFHFWAVRHASAHLERARCAEDELYGHFRALCFGQKELKLSRPRRERFLTDVLGQSVHAVRDSRTRGLLTYVGAGSWGAFMFFVVIGSVIFLLSAFIEIGPGVRSGYALMFLYTMFPLEDLLEAVPDLVRTRIALDRIVDICGQDPDAPRPPGRALAAGPFARLQLAQATHRYQHDTDDGVFELGPITLELKPGEVVYLIGGNGSGKTTLAKLLVGLYGPERGDLQFNGEVVDVASRGAYRQHFSAVFSDFHVFEQLLGLPVAGLEARAEALLAELGLAKKVTVRGGRFSTTALSSGQRKRLALLVACLEDRPVYVFDEWASDQDPSYKDAFYRRIVPELRARGKAVLVITHDDRYFHLADRCLKLEFGQLVGGAAPGHVETAAAATLPALPPLEPG